ncbi:MAG: hypothetical protein RIC29_07075 [Rhodospirillaceae bacterium]
MIDSARGFVAVQYRLKFRKQWALTPIVAGFLVASGVCSVYAQSSQVDQTLDAESLQPPTSLFSDSASSESRNSDTPAVSGGEIAVRQLEEVSTDSIGVLDEFSDGFPLNLWEGTSKELVDLLLPKLPDQTPSVVTRELVQRLLLSVARPPEETKTQDVFVDMTAIVPSALGFNADENLPEDTSALAEPQETNAGLVLLELRLARLAAMGDWTSVQALLEVIPQDSFGDRMQILSTDLALVEGRVDDACDAVQANLRMSKNVYWQKTFAFCQLRDGNVSSAYLTIDLLRETGVNDPAFFWVSELMAGNRPITPAGLDRLTPLQLAMLRSAGRPFPPQLVTNGDPTLLKVLATAELLYVADDGLDEEGLAERVREARDRRLDAAERAVGLGALDPEILRTLYRSEVEEDTDNEQPASSATASNEDVSSAEEDLNLRSIPVSTPVDRAKLFQLAESQTILTARAEVISRAIDFARNDRGQNGPNVSVMGAVYAPLLKTIEPSGDLVWFAGNAARALLAVSEMEAGEAWLELSQLYARTSIEASEVAAAMWPTERQLQPTLTNRFTPLRLKRWEDSRPPGLRAADKALVLSTLMALGEPVASEDWLDLMDRRTHSSIELPRPQIWNGLSLAAKNGRIGETVLFAVLALSEEGPEGVSPVVLSHVVSSLMTIGLENEARRVAVEAALARGL